VEEENVGRGGGCGGGRRRRRFHYSGHLEDQKALAMLNRLPKYERY
jgi:hypothetical protein